MTGDRPTTPGWHCHRCRSTSCRQRADSDTDHVGRVEYRPLLLTQPSSVSWLWSHTHWCPSQRPQEVMRVDGSANPTMPKNPTQYPSLSAGRDWLGSSLSSEPGGLTGLSVASHAGVLARSKISGSLLHRLSRPWHGLGPRGSHRDQRTTIRRSPQIFFACGGRSILLMLSNRRLSILLFRFSLLLLERTSATSSQIVLTNSLKLKQTHVREACVCWSSLNDPRVR